MQTARTKTGGAILHDLTQQLTRAGWRRNEATGDWSHPTHGSLTRASNRWYATGESQPFRTLAAAAIFALMRQAETLFV